MALLAMSHPLSKLSKVQPSKMHWNMDFMYDIAAFQHWGAKEMIPSTVALIHSPLVAQSTVSAYSSHIVIPSTDVVMYYYSTVSPPFMMLQSIKHRAT